MATKSKSYKVVKVKSPKYSVKPLKIKKSK